MECTEQTLDSDNVRAANVTCQRSAAFVYVAEDESKSRPKSVCQARVPPLLSSVPVPEFTNTKRVRPFWFQQDR